MALPGGRAWESRDSSRSALAAPPQRQFAALQRACWPRLRASSPWWGLSARAAARAGFLVGPRLRLGLRRLLDSSLPLPPSHARPGSAATGSAFAAPLVLGLALLLLQLFATLPPRLLHFLVLPCSPFHFARLGPPRPLAHPVPRHRLRDRRAGLLGILDAQAQLRAKGIQRLHRPARSELPRLQPLVIRCLRHRAARQVVPQQVYPQLLTHHRRRLATQLGQTQTLLERADIHLRVPAAEIQTPDVLLAGRRGVRHRRDQVHLFAPETWLLHRDTQHAHRDLIGQRVPGRLIDGPGPARLFPALQVIVLAQRLAAVEVLLSRYRQAEAAIGLA